MILGMDFRLDDDHHCEPRISLSKLPGGCCKLRDPLQVPVPPVGSPVSIPFHWEEAPGRPRATSSPPPPSAKSKAAPLRRLDLPPGFLSDGAKFTIIPSPATSVLDGRSLSLARSFSFRKGAAKRSGGGVGKIVGGSARWVSLEMRDEGKFVWGSLDIPHGPSGRKKKSFFGLYSMASNLWGDIYGSFRQAVAVPWRRAF